MSTKIEGAWKYRQEFLTGTSGGLISSASSEISLFKSKATDLESTDVGSKL